jgi:AcrR family transcriptional regulator
MGEGALMQPKTRNKIIDATMALASERPWEEVTLAVIAERSGLTLAALRSGFDGRTDILAEFVRRTDETVLASVDPDMAEEAPRERLFDVLFSRFEALAPHKQAIRNLGHAARRDPLLALELNRIVAGSMAWMLTVAGLGATGGGGLFRAQGLAFVYAGVMRVWLGDDDPGLARTMAELDRRLRRAERMALRLDRVARILRPPRRSGRSRRGTSADDSDIAEGHPS